MPSSIFLNGQKCILLNVGGQALSLSDSVGSGASKESVEQPLSLSGSQIIGTDGNVVNFHGLNWFGFEVSNGFGGSNPVDNLSIASAAEDLNAYLQFACW